MKIMIEYWVANIESLRSTDLGFNIFEVQETKLPVRLLNTTNEWRLVQGYEMREKVRYIEVRLYIHWCANIKDEVEKLAYQLKEAERKERKIRRLSKVMYGSTCADMQVDVMGECLSSIKHVVGTTSGCFLPEVESLGEDGGRPQCDKCGCRVQVVHSIVSRLWRQFQTTGTAIRGSVVVVHEEPHPQMTGTLSYSPEETGGRQRRNR
ncbi:uncharacterized protein TNCV_1661331 [Trichonephila clavipes]|nr:uncharacterized protein TNCV_1661331 [Trichonephila clavipes]